MPQIRTVDLADARNRLKRRTSGFDARAPFRAAIANMTDARMIELEPEGGESMRSLKLNVTRAAKEVHRDVRHGESEQGTLLVWLQDKPRRTRGPRRRTGAGAVEE
jgi:hypothetical protein